MADNLKKFFKKKKLEFKFKKAGPGHRLDENASSSAPPQSPQKSSVSRIEPSAEARHAAAAALARFENRTTTTAGLLVSLVNHS